MNRPDIPEFAAALDLAHQNDEEPQPACLERPRRFVDYQTPPSAHDALALCAECPLLDLCRQNAEAMRPAWGVWGGEVWKSGVRVAR